MLERKIIHATLVQVEKKGVLLTGKSASGKSDLALRLIENKKAKLVADDVVEVCVQNGKLSGCAPKSIAGLLEVRNIGVVRYPYLSSANVDIIVALKESQEDIQRMPLRQKELILGLEINKIDLYAKENSAPEKIVAALRWFEQNQTD